MLTWELLNQTLCLRIEPRNQVILILYSACWLRLWKLYISIVSWFLNISSNRVLWKETEMQEEGRKEFFLFAFCFLSTSLEKWPFHPGRSNWFQFSIFVGTFRTSLIWTPENPILNFYILVLQAHHLTFWGVSTDGQWSFLWGMKPNLMGSSSELLRSQKQMISAPSHISEPQFHGQSSELLGANHLRPPICFSHLQRW